MGQKVHPVGLRLGIVKDHSSVWYAEKANYADLLLKDMEIREFISGELKNAFVSKISIERPRDRVIVTIHTGRPGVVIGTKGADIERLKAKLSDMLGQPVVVNVAEIRKQEIDAFLVAQNVAQQLERRVSFRRAMKRAVTNALKFGVEGVKIRVAGRLGGVEIARAESYHEGRVPLHTLRATLTMQLLKRKRLTASLGSRCGFSKAKFSNAPALPKQRGPRPCCSQAGPSFGNNRKGAIVA